MEKCSNQAGLDELTSTLMSVINNCPPEKKTYKGMGEEEELKYNNCQKRARIVRAADRGRVAETTIGKQGNSFRGMEIGNRDRERLEVGDSTRIILRTAKTGIARISIKRTIKRMVTQIIQAEETIKGTQLIREI